MDLDEILNTGLKTLTPAEMWLKLDPYRPKWSEHQRVARVVAWIIQAGGAPSVIESKRATELLSNAWPKDPYVLAGLTTAVAFAQTAYSVNDAPKADPELSQLLSRLLIALDEEPPVRPGPWAAAAAAMRREGTAMTARAIPLFQEALGRDNSRSDTWYNLGICLKESGRWGEALDANLTSRGLRDTIDAATEWNLGISAVAEGNGELALEAWTALNLQTEPGAHGLPVFVGAIMMCKLELVQRTRPDRACDLSEDTPGESEVVWMRRLGPCHGEIVAATVGRLCADIGDIVLHDALACGTEDFGDSTLPIFPVLTVLRRGGWQTFACVAHAQSSADFDPIDEALEPAQLHLFPGLESGLLHGKIAVPPGVTLASVSQCLAKALEENPRVKLTVPGLPESS